MNKAVLYFFLFILFSVEAQELSVMTYNIKLDYPKEGKDSWTNRKPFFMNQLKFYEPDVLCVQEAMPNQMKDIDSVLVSYDFVGVGRDDGKDKGEYSAIFYKKDKFKVLESSTFWLSETPDKVGFGWDATYNRICTYALFEDLKSKQKFWTFNTHFDHISLKSRENSTTLIVNKIKEINTQDFPVILTGDFNMEPNHENVKFLQNSLNDSKAISRNTFGPEGTFNGFHFDQPVTKRIDYIFVSHTVSVDKYAVLSDSWELKYPSDHFPVFVSLKLNE